MNAIVHTAPANAYTGLDRFLRTRLLRQLDALEGRAVELHDALGSECVGRGDAPPLRLRDYINLENTTATHPFVLHKGDKEIIYFASNRFC